ncbi:MAG: aminotransferase class I/II-fold pyridoxal phosphate-dependent enzyme [Chloroflexota bacterium]
MQRAVLAYCRNADLDAHVAQLRITYRQRRDAMLAALQEHFPAGTTWTTPQGGIFIWLTLPVGADATTLLAAALHQGVAFVPGAAFFPPSLAAPASRALRLNFSNAAPQRINEGIERLAHALRLHLERAA